MYCPFVKLTKWIIFLIIILYWYKFYCSLTEEIISHDQWVPIYFFFKHIINLFQLSRFTKFKLKAFLFHLCSSYYIDLPVKGQDHYTMFSVKALSYSRDIFWILCNYVSKSRVALILKTKVGNVAQNPDVCCWRIEMRHAQDMVTDLAHYYTRLNFIVYCLEYRNKI